MKKSLLFFCIFFTAHLLNGQGVYTVSASSFLGDNSITDQLRGAKIQSNGNIVLAANIGIAAPGGMTPVLLNGATATSGGVILRLSPDGKKLLSITRLAVQVLDLSLDNNDNIFVAAGTDGLLKLNPQAGSITWQKLKGTHIHRVDAASDGHSVALKPGDVSKADDAGGPGQIYVHDANGTEVSNFAGYRNSLDLCIDPVNKLVILAGWRQDNAHDGTKVYPVQISYIRAHDYKGVVKWLAYDWSVDTTSARFINKPTNNMADTRAYRCVIGGDGKLYVSYDCAGGNHIFRYDPFDIMKKSSIVGGDKYHNFSNTKSEHKTFFGKYEPATGAYLLGQQLTNRLSSGAGNTIKARSLAVDKNGRVYIGGEAASGLPPMDFSPGIAGTYTGGSWLMVMSADFKTRLYVTRLNAGGSTRAIDARVLSGTDANIVWGGWAKYSNPDSALYTVNAIQPKAGGITQDGYFAVIAPFTTGLPEPAGQTDDLAEVYPNPSSDYITLKINQSSSGKYAVRIYNSLGSLVVNHEYDASVNMHEIDVSSFPEGVYFLDISTGQAVSPVRMVRKLVIGGR